MFTVPPEGRQKKGNNRCEAAHFFYPRKNTDDLFICVVIVFVSYVGFVNSTRVSSWRTPSASWLRKKKGKKHENVRFEMRVRFGFRNLGQAMREEMRIKNVTSTALMFNRI